MTSSTAQRSICQRSGNGATSPASGGRFPLAAYLINSLVIAGVATLIVLAVSLPAAYFTARHHFRGRRAFLYAVLITQMFAPVAHGVRLAEEITQAEGYSDRDAPTQPSHATWT
jgi:ABC-type glycerol-3-phosphate transport system permease component